MKIKIITKAAIAALVVLFSGSMIAKVTSVKSEGKWGRKLDKEPFTVALFFEEMKGMDKAQKREINRLEDMFNQTSRGDLYRDGKVGFAKVNVAREKLSQLDDQFGISRLPAFVLFKNGQPVRDRMNRIATLSGLANRAQLKSFIDEHLKKDINKYIDERHERLRRRSEEREYRRDYYPGAYWYGGYPGYYWGYPYYGFGHHGYYW